MAMLVYRRVSPGKILGRAKHLGFQEVMVEGWQHRFHHRAAVGSQIEGSWVQFVSRQTPYGVNQPHKLKGKIGKC